eukprot:1262418-Prymnesium_polylepis.4
MASPLSVALATRSIVAIWHVARKRRARSFQGYRLQRLCHIYVGADEDIRVLRGTSRSKNTRRIPGKAGCPGSIGVAHQRQDYSVNDCLQGAWIFDGPERAGQADCDRGHSRLVHGTAIDTFGVRSARRRGAR